MSIQESPATAPEPGITQEEMVASAVALRSQLVAEQAATEERRYYSPELHEAFMRAGFYHLYVPRRYGGQELDVPTYARVIKEIARGCVSTGWCLGLTINHALQAGSWWPESAQDTIFANNDFRGGSVAAPVGIISPTDDGWEINGQVAFASGTPYGTHYVGQAILAGTEKSPTPELMMFVAHRSGWEMLDDWGDLIGLKGSGSHSIRFEGTRIPKDWAFPGFMIDIDVSGGTPGARLHDNPMYIGRGMTIYTMSLAAVTVGGVWNGLDAYEELLRTKTTPTPPFGPRVKDHRHHQWYGKAITRAKLAEMLLDEVAEQHMELCRRAYEDPEFDYSYGEDMHLAAVARELMVLCWEIFNDDLWQTMGASAARDDARISRVFRDMSIAVAHRNPQMREMIYGEIGRWALDEPRVPFGSA
jgi:3-hydroxy-9,10-secoandrosta-1,3,5(10)-triene-9,17-dione monooxygenase